MTTARAFKNLMGNALFTITNISSIYIVYITFSNLSTYICYADLSTTAFENPLWTHRESILKWSSILHYLIYVRSISARKDSTHFPLWGVHFEAAMYVGGYLAGLCVLRLMYDLFVKFRMILGIIGIFGIVRSLVRESGQNGQEEKISSNCFSGIMSPEIHLNEVSAEEIDGDSEDWSSDGMLTPPSTPDLEAYGEDFEYEEWDCWAE